MKGMNYLKGILRSGLNIHSAETDENTGANYSKTLEIPLSKKALDNYLLQNYFIDSEPDSRDSVEEFPEQIYLNPNEPGVKDDPRDIRNIKRDNLSNKQEKNIKKRENIDKKSNPDPVHHEDHNEDVKIAGEVVKKTVQSDPGQKRTMKIEKQKSQNVPTIKKIQSERRKTKKTGKEVPTSLSGQNRIGPDKKIKMIELTIPAPWTKKENGGHLLSTGDETYLKSDQQISSQEQDQSPGSNEKKDPGFVRSLKSELSSVYNLNRSENQNRIIGLYRIKEKLSETNLIPKIISDRTVSNDTIWKYLNETRAEIRKLSDELKSIKEELEQSKDKERMQNLRQPHLPKRPVCDNLGGWSIIERSYIKV